MQGNPDTYSNMDGWPLRTACQHESDTKGHSDQEVDLGQVPALALSLWDEYQHQELVAFTGRMGVCVCVWSGAGGGG